MVTHVFVSELLKTTHDSLEGVLSRILIESHQAICANFGRFHTIQLAKLV